MNISFISGVSHILPRKWSFMGSSSVEIKPDFFEKESEHIADVQIYKKNGILKKPVLASIYKTGEAKKEKYTMVRNDKILGDQSVNSLKDGLNSAYICMKVRESAQERKFVTL